MDVHDKIPAHTSKPTAIQMAFIEAIIQEFGKGGVEVTILPTSENIEEIECPVRQEFNSCPSHPYCRSDMEGEIPF